MNKKEIIDSLKGGLILSCQASQGEPHYMPGIAVTFAKCAQWAGAVGIRANSPDDVRAIKKEVNLPVIGLWKINRNQRDVYLTPNFEAAKALWDAGAEIIAVQSTDHFREDGKKSYETIKEIKRNIPEAIVFADVATVEDAKIAIQYGADIVAPSMAGYTKAGHYDKIKLEDRPDLDLLRGLLDIAEGTDTKVVMEGKVTTPEMAVQCCYLGAHAVVVGNAITRPHITAARFVKALNKNRQDKSKFK